MHLFEGTVEDAAREAGRPEFITACESRFTRLFGVQPSEQEVRSWRRSWPALLSALTHANLGQLRVLLEYSLPATGERVDALLVGEFPDGVLGLVAVELKQWTHVDTDRRRPGLVRAGGRVVQHPARQVGGYVAYLDDWVAREEIPLRVHGIAVLHDASAELVSTLRALTTGGPSARFPVLGREDLATHQAPDDVARALGCDQLRPPALEKTNSLLAVEHRPSPALLARVGQVIEGHDAIQLIGEQDTARQQVFHAVSQARRDGRRSVIVVTGGPGTGKTVIACRLLGGLCRQADTDPRLLSPSGTLTRQLKRTVGEASRGLITTFTGKLPQRLRDSSIVLLDEAHRARTGLPEQRPGFPVILGQLLRTAAVTVLLLDEQQTIRPTEGVTLKEVAQYAQSNSLEFAHIDLTTQFRCNGSQAYRQWIDQLLTPEGSAPAWEGTDYELVLANNPDEFTHWVNHHDALDGQTARVSAGFCWPWKSPPTPPLLDEVEIRWVVPEGQRTWARPWNLSENDSPFDAPDIPGRPFWATDEGGHNQVGCVYTAQGMEYTHNVVIIGEDLIRRDGRWVAQPTKSHDPQLNWLPPERYLTYALNTYRVLLTRGTKATRLYSTHPHTQTYLETLLPQAVA